MPLDTTPRGDEMVRRLPERKFPEPKRPGNHEDSEMGGTPLGQEAPDVSREDSEAQEISRRPSLPDHPAHMPADEGNVE